MDTADKKSFELAEKICKKKFDEKFGDFNQSQHLTKEEAVQLFKEQMKLWEELGQTNLTEEEVKNLPPIKQALHSLCFDKVIFCMTKLMGMK